MLLYKRGIFMRDEFKLIYLIVITLLWILSITLWFKTTLWQLGATIVAFALIVPGLKRERK
jgi:hypothetical protein